jgi:hypothetical protein
MTLKDGTEHRRADALEAFQAFRRGRTSAASRPANEHGMQGDGAVARAQYVVLPTRWRASKELHDALGALVECFARDGRVTRVTRTVVLACDASTAGGWIFQ